jgi:hypothetical protein
VTAPDFEISTRLRADSLIAHVTPDVRITVDGDDVTLARRQTRRRVPAKLEPGGVYENVLIEGRLIGERRASRTNYSPLELPAANSKALSRDRSTRAGMRAAVPSSRPDQEVARSDRRGRGDELGHAAMRRAERAKRRRTRAENAQRRDGARLRHASAGASADVLDPARVTHLLANAGSRLPVPAAVGLGALVGLFAGAAAAIKWAGLASPRARLRGRAAQRLAPRREALAADNQQEDR